MEKKSASGGSYPLSGNLLNLHPHLKKKTNLSYSLPRTVETMGPAELNIKLNQIVRIALASRYTAIPPPPLVFSHLPLTLALSLSSLLFQRPLPPTENVWIHKRGLI